MGVWAWRRALVGVAFIWLAGAAAGADLAALKLRADAGEGDAQLELALAFDDGKLTPADPAQALQWYHRAAAQNVGAAEMQLGYFAEVGRAEPQDYVSARAHYQRAIALGVPAAGLRLGLLNLEGWGGPKDKQEAVRLITGAADAGDIPSEKVLAGMYFVGYGVPRDLARAAQLQESAARSGDAEAQTAMGAQLARLHARDDDLALARDWYQLSAEKEYAAGMIGMASTFFRPGASGADIALGINWLELAAEGGSGDAAKALAAVYLMNPGFNTQPDKIDTARRLLVQAKASGDWDAAEVFEVEKSGRSLPDAMRYVLTEPQDSRYIQEDAARTQPDANGNRPPHIIRVIRPVYPFVMRLSRTEGDVVVDFVVDKTGRVRRAKAISSTHPAFTDLAVLSVMKWQFEPGMRKGRVVAVHVQVPVYFRLNSIILRSPDGRPNRDDPGASATAASDAAESPGH